MRYQLCKNVMPDKKKREGFNTLIKNTFWLSFENWYQSGKWGEWNMPYTLFDGEKAVANVTVNRMKFLYEGKARNYIQLGGVATDPDYRKQGLSRYIMEEVLKDFKEDCDGIFLMANGSVTQFYPRFGFEEQNQYQWKKAGKAGDAGLMESQLSQDPKTENLVKLNLEDATDVETMLACYRKKNPFAKLQLVENESLLWFYCEVAIGDNLFYLPQEDALVIAECDEDQVNIYDIYYNGPKTMNQIIDVFCGACKPNITLLFTPTEETGFTEEQYVDEDTHLFVLKGKENIFENARLYVPDISHT